MAIRRQRLCLAGWSSGAGQVRRLVSADNLNATIELDYPFLTTLDSSSLVQVGDRATKEMTQPLSNLPARHLFGSGQLISSLWLDFAPTAGPKR